MMTFQRRMITMENQHQFLRKTAVFLGAFAIIASLLSSFAAAQNLPTMEERAAWLIEQCRGESIKPNAKHGPAVALARLALNPDDAHVIDRITHYYDELPAVKNGEQFTYYGVAWVLGKYWDKFTPAQRDHLKSRIKGFSDLLGHGTENHAIMKGAAAYLFAQYWPDESGWVRGEKTSAEVMETARDQMLAVMRSLYDKGYAEDLSPTYAPVHLAPYYALYECATDPEMKAAADAALHFHLANIAANHFEGTTIPPVDRDKPSRIENTNTSKDRKNLNTSWIHWLYWADAQNWMASSKPSRSNDIRITYSAVTSWRPPAAIDCLARGKTVPYELTGAASAFGFWGGGAPANCMRYVYRNELYAMGSGFFRYAPRGYYVYYTAFRLIYKSPDLHNFLACYHPYWRSNDRSWRGLNSPFQQWAQYKGTAIALFNIPTADPWVGLGRPRGDWQALRDDHSKKLIQEALLSYPKSIDQKTESNGWIFLREGDVYIAIRPLKPYTIDANYSQAIEDAVHSQAIEGFNVVRSAFAQTGFVFDIATKGEFATFEAFQAAVSQNPLVVDWDQLSVTYTNVKDDTLTATWNPPKYDVPEGERVLVRADITVNGAEVPIDNDFINARAVMKSSSVELVDRVLRLRTPAGQLEVDWRQKVPKFSRQ